MKPGRARQSGFTLVELCVVIAIIAILVALLIPAVQRVRHSALHLHSVNNVKQLGLAMHGYENTYRIFPHIRLGTNPVSKEIEYSFFVALLPFIEQGTLYRQFKTRLPGGGINGDFLIPVFLSPLDPTQPKKPHTSYAANGSTFNRSVGLKHIRDGASNTIGLAEHYAAKCGRTIFFWTDGTLGSDTKDWASHRPTFADRRVGDVYPVSQRQVAAASVPGLTFQLAPTLQNCDPRLAQAASHQGLVTGVIDGSVRTLHSSVSESIYWGLVTPNGGETVAW